MKKLIIYTSGGLSNRIFPIASSISLSKKYNRELLIYWPIDRCCLGHFNDLYDTELNFIDDVFLNTLIDDETEYHTKHHASVINSRDTYGRTFLSNKLDGGKVLINRPINFEGDSDILLLDNNFMSTVTYEENISELQNLKFKEDIINKSNELNSVIGLDKSVVGIHARGTDFNPDINFYVNQINQVLGENIDTKFYISSDDNILEDTLIGRYPNNITRRVKTNYIEKHNENHQRWSNNIKITLPLMVESIIDMLLLSKTDFRIYNNLSTFAEYIKILSKKK
jgi:hypothetical protein